VDETDSTYAPPAGEAELVAALQAGDERAFASLVDEHGPAMLRVAQMYVSSRAVAEEVVQEAWLGVISGIRRFEGRSSLRTWIFRILTNRAKTRGEREGRTVPFSSLATSTGDGDESAVDAGAPVGAICGHEGTGPASLNIGSVHFFGLDADGTITANGLVERGAWNLPFHQTPGTCTGHVFWTAPNENRLVNAWYTEGARILDFSDPANVKQLGWFKSDKPTQYWSAKPHRGYIFATDMDRGLDIMRYTGEGGARWPARAGPAEVQRAKKEGVPYVPLPGSGQLPVVKDKRSIGRFSFTAKLRFVPKGKVTLAFTDSRGKTIERVKFKGKKRVKASGIAVAGRYRWTIKVGTKVLARGTLRVKKKNGATLSPRAKMDAKVK